MDIIRFIWLDDAMCPDPLVRAEDAEAFRQAHEAMCASTGADPAFVSVRRVADWLGASARKAKAAHA